MESRKHSIWVQMRGRNCISTVDALMMELQECGIEIHWEILGHSKNSIKGSLKSLQILYSTNPHGWLDRRVKTSCTKSISLQASAVIFWFLGLEFVCTLLRSPAYSSVHPYTQALQISLHMKEPGFVWISSNLNSVWWIVSIFVQSLLLVIVGSSRCLWILI